MLLPVLTSAQGFKTVIEGTVEDTKAVVVFDPLVNRQLSNPTPFPVVDGKFTGVLKSDIVKQYYICTIDEWNRGGMKMRPFYPDADTVRITIVKEREYPDYEVEGGAVNSSMNAYRAEYNRTIYPRYDALMEKMEPMYDADNYRTEAGAKIEEQIEAAIDAGADSEALAPLFNKRDELMEQRLFYSPEMQVYEDEWDVVKADEAQFELEWMDAHPDLHTYAMLISQAQQERFLPQTSAVYAKIAAANPGHPYGEMAENYLRSQALRSPDGKFIDFTAPDIDGTEHTLSKEIAGRVSVIHFWASWCGPCRVHGLHLMPLYEKYADKGFAVVGVAREYKDTRALAAALERDKYPWLNLIELDDSTGLWTKYGLTGPGCIVIVDENGTLVNPDATVAEIEKYLAERFE